MGRFRWFFTNDDGGERVHEERESRGLVFHARLDLDVPLAVLERHGLRVRDEAARPPETLDPRFGRWVPFEVWYRDDGFRRTMLPRNARGHVLHSPVGLQPEDGGAFLGFLKAGRAIVESGLADGEKLRRLAELAFAGPAHRSFAWKLGRDFARRWIQRA